ncbi:MAG TPA: hypothetical protein DIW47_11220 [Bacteroidetes bacterium]|nr:hypothetical protein [Bacteroidota bacterium]
MPTLSLIIPCYNPSKNWEKELVQHAKGFAAFIDQEFKLILVNDASSTGIDKASIQFIKDNLTDFQYISYDKNRGKGYALRTGVATLNEGLVMYTDIDFPYEYASMKAIWMSLREGNDVAVGTRNDVYYENTPKKRTFISKLLRFVLRRIFRLPITDTQCGLKGFNQKGKKIFLQTRIERFLFDMEFIALASRDKEIKMKPVAVSLRRNIQFSKMNAKILLTESINLFRIYWLTHFR